MCTPLTFQLKILYIFSNELTTSVNDVMPFYMEVSMIFLGVLLRRISNTPFIIIHTKQIQLTA